ncbi:MAG TPA: hypothetical protein PLC92_08740, partial [Chitinophagales bacterium]|nr:hypothetical protein [Chitinophagales bacterium]
EKAFRSQMAALTSYMKRGENVLNKLEADSLTKYFTLNGTSPLKSITSTYYSNLIESTWFSTMVSSSQNVYDPLLGETAINGGVYSNRLLDKRAKETLQEIEKGLFSAALFNHLISLAQNSMTEASVDKMVCIYGAHPTFPNTNNLANTTTPDAYIALYAARRDKADGNGFYTKTKDQFIKLKAAIAAGNNYNEEKNAAIAEIKLLIEKSLMATVINYGYAATTKFNTIAAPATTIAGGLHDVGEIIGFIHGLKSIPAVHRKISDTQIDNLLSLFLAPAGAEASVYKFVTSPTTEVAKIAQAQQAIQTIYGFTASEMNDFKNNYISLMER